ncbi:ribonuclease J [Candidatus Peregrinibacteria bacterium]|nr:ribonuclease J [Candidatus Peregrinibacteria bacterium]
MRGNKTRTVQVPKRQSKPTPILKAALKMIPLGGLNEVGKNMMALEYENDIIILDMGLEFPSEDLLGIDYVIPDVTYLEDNKDRIRGIVITHGHLDHIGGIPYILPRLNFPPVYATKLTAGLITKRAEEFKQEKTMQLRIFNADEKIRLGQFLVSFIRVTHSIPDCVAIVVDTPVGKIIDTGDFKFDETPASEFSLTDIDKLEKMAQENVLALF